MDEYICAVPPVSEDRTGRGRIFMTLSTPILQLERASRRRAKLQMSVSSEVDQKVLLGLLH